MMRSILILTAAVALSACDQPQGVDQPLGASPPAPAAVLGPTTAAAVTPPLAAAGEPATLQPWTGDIQQAASVTEVVVLKGQGDTTVKLFGVAGGDPAMNGLQTYIAFFIDPAEGWRVFQIGDLLAFRVLTAAPGRVDLQISESRYDTDAGTIGQQTRRLIVGFTVGEDGAAPTTISVTPAR